MKKKKLELAKLEEAPTEMIPLTDPEKYKEMVKQAMPEFVREMDQKEDLGTATFEAASEFWMATVDSLRRYHNWSDEEIHQLHRELTDVLTGVKEFEDAGLSMLSLNSIKVVGDNVEGLGIKGLLSKIADLRYQKSRMIRAGMDTAKELDEKDFTKKLK